jgi:hypothetical protein
VRTGSYGTVTSAGRDGPAGPAGSQARAIAWPVCSGLVSPAADGWISRETGSALAAALEVPGSAVALVPAGEPEEHASARPGSCGKTQLAPGFAGAPACRPALRTGSPGSCGADLRELVTVIRAAADGCGPRRKPGGGV